MVIPGNERASVVNTVIDGFIRMHEALDEVIYDSVNRVEQISHLRQQVAKEPEWDKLRVSSVHALQMRMHIHHRCICTYTSVHALQIRMHIYFRCVCK